MILCESRSVDDVLDNPEPLAGIDHAFDPVLIVTEGDWVCRGRPFQMANPLLGWENAPATARDGQEVADLLVAGKRIREG